MVAAVGRPGHGPIEAALESSPDDQTGPSPSSPFVKGTACRWQTERPCRSTPHPDRHRSTHWGSPQASSPGGRGRRGTLDRAQHPPTPALPAWPATAPGSSPAPTMVNGHGLRFAEGPASGPPLLLIHAQSTDLWSWAPVMPALARDFHVFAVDVPGHGASDWDPELYNGPVLGELFADFIAGVIGEQAIVAGHSSGGLIAAWIAAARPGEAVAAVLEDPPLFSSVPPRSEATWNHVELARTCLDFLRSTRRHFTEFLLERSQLFDLFGPAGKRIRADALRRRRAHRDKPPTLPYMPPAMNEAYRALDSYDPMFGLAFFDGAFHDLFDHADTLSAISRPTLFLHCDWQTRDGILLGAMDDADAAHAQMLIGGRAREESGIGARLPRRASSGVRAARPCIRARCGRRGRPARVAQAVDLLE